MKGKYVSFAVGLVFLLVLRCELSHGLTVDLGASQDNTLYEDPDGLLSNGSGPVLFAGISGLELIQRGLLQFDVASEIPAGATITSANLTLYLSKTLDEQSGDIIQLHRVEAAWGEGASMAGGGGPGSGGGMGAPAEPGDATWTHRINPTDTWTTPGGDFSATPSSSQSVFGLGFYSWGSTPQLVSDVQGWLNDPNSNFGWLLQGNEAENDTAKRFDSREYPDPSRRPVLTIEYETAGGLSADFNNDTYVDGADLSIWEAAYNLNNNGDTDDDGDSDGVDFLNWQQQFTGPPGALQAVPEPSGVALLYLAAVSVLGTRCRLLIGT